MGDLELARRAWKRVNHGRRRIDFPIIFAHTELKTVACQEKIEV